MLTIFWNLLFFIVAIGILVTIHELGHFWVARFCGVKVQRFSFGFGKPLLSWYDKKGTEFVVAPILLGGYVKMLDKRNEEVPEHLKDQEFTGKSVGQRMAIMFAGPFANFVMAVLVLWLAFMVGQLASKPVIGTVMPDSVIAKAGITESSQILSVGDRQTLGWRDVNFAVVRYIGDDKMPMQVLDLKTNVTKTYELDIANATLDQQGKHIFELLGFLPYRPKVTLEVNTVTDGSAAQRGGLLAGDVIQSVNGEVIENWSQLVALIQSHPAKVMDVIVQRGTTTEPLMVTPDSNTGADGIARGFLGMRPVAETWPDEYIVNLKYGFFDSFGQAMTKTGELIDLSFVMLGKLFTADVSLKNLSGPVSIAQGAGNSAERGLFEFLVFLALISVNLGIINLLPVPMLDGGHLFYYTIELIRGKSVSQRAQEIGLMCGAFVLFLLMGISIFNDISRLS